ncbi:MAG: hypothetical protein DRJ67_09260, partial [Thermoprotei archaeon]
MSGELTEFYRAKIAALLHDPPYKHYCLLRGVKHEEEARRFRRLVLEGTPLERLGIGRIVERADVVASGFDRWLIDFAVKGRIVSANVFANIFDPEKSTPLPRPEWEWLVKVAEKAADELNALLK